jgi:hypothetical protein
MKRKHMLWFAGLAIAVFLGWLFLWSGRTPDGQPPLTYLTGNSDEFKRYFDGASGNVRMVLLLSPT